MQNVHEQQGFDTNFKHPILLQLHTQSTFVRKFLQGIGCVHFLRVAQSRECKMPTANIAKVFAPTLVGYSSPHPEPVQMLSEAKVQPKVCI